MRNHEAGGESRPHLPFLPDKYGVCVVTGLTNELWNGGEEELDRQMLLGFEQDRALENDERDDEKTKKDRPVARRTTTVGFNFYDEGMNGSDSWGGESIEIYKIEPDCGSRAGYDLVKLVGSFPLVVDANLVLVSFGDKLLQPIRWSTKAVEFYTASAQGMETSVDVYISLDGGQTFVGNNIIFTYDESGTQNVVKHGAHVYLWGNTYPIWKGIRSEEEKSRQTGNNKYKPRWVETKFPSIPEGKQIIIGEVLRKALSLSDRGSENLDLHSIKNLVRNGSMEASSETLGAIRQAEKQLFAFQTQGMFIKDIACSERSLLVLLEDGSMVTQFPVVSETPSSTLASNNSLVSLLDIARYSSEPSTSSRSISNTAQKLSWEQRGPFKTFVIPIKQEQLSGDADVAWFFEEKTRPANLNLEPQPESMVFPRFHSVSQVAAGAYHFCALTDTMSGANLFTWGDNKFGQLGLGFSGGAVLEPSKVNFGRVSSVLKMIACGPDTTSAVGVCREKGTVLFSWGNGGSKKQNLKNQLIQSTKATFPHRNVTNIPSTACYIKPTLSLFESESVPCFWNSNLDDWLLEIEKDWSLLDSAESQEEIELHSTLIDLMENHFLMKQSFVEDLELTLNQGNDNKNVYDPEREDIALKELDGLIDSIEFAITKLNARIDSVTKSQTAYHYEIRAIDLAIARCRKEVSELNINPTQGRLNSSDFLTRDRGGSVTEKEEESRKSSISSEPSSPRRSRKSSIWSNFKRRMTSVTGRRESESNQSEQLQQELGENDLEEKENISAEYSLWLKQRRISDLEAHRTHIMVQLEKDEVIADEALEELQELEASLLLYQDLRTDWRVEQELLISNVHEREFADDFDIVRELLADAQTCDLVTISERSEMESQSLANMVQSSMGITTEETVANAVLVNQAKLFSRPGEMVRESLPIDTDTVDFTHRKGLKLIVEQLDKTARSIQTAVANSSAEDKPTRALLDLTDDICSLKQVYLEGMLCVSNETERMLGLKLATEFACSTFHDIPTISKDTKIVSPYFSTSQ